MKTEIKLFKHIMLRGLDNVAGMIIKAKEYALQNSMTEAELLEAKLASDMFDFKKQVQIFTDGAVGGVYRTAGLEKPSLPEADNNFDDLMTRINTAKDFINKVDFENEETLEGVEDKKISMPWMPEGAYFEMETYVKNFLFTNNFFHLSMCYAILRHKGIPLGKMDFNGQMEMKFDK